MNEDIDTLLNRLEAIIRASTNIKRDIDDGKIEAGEMGYETAKAEKDRQTTRAAITALLK